MENQAAADRHRTIREQFLAVDTCTVSDVLDDMGLENQGISPGIQAVSGDRIAGWAYTIVGKAIPYDGTTDELKMQACQQIGPDEVSVWSGDGTGICYFGELIALGMLERGSTGALVDGGLRDTRALKALTFPAFARYRSPVQSIGRWRVTGFQTTVFIGGATTSFVAVHPGDFVLGDDDGAVIIPARAVDEVLHRAVAVTDREACIRSGLREGLSLGAAAREFGHV